MPDFSFNFVGPAPRLRGRNFSLPTTESHINAFNSNTFRWDTVFDADYALDISSSSANDDGSPAGTGARTIEIYGLDKYFNFQKETVTLNGTTIVTTTKTWRRVFEIVVQTAGALFKNEGDIYVVKTGTGGTYTTPGVPGTLTSAAIKALAGDNFGLSGIWTAPRGTTYSLAGLSLTARAQAGTIKVQHGYPAGNGLVYPSLKIDYTPGMPVSAPANLIVVNEKEDIYLTGLAASAGGFVSVVAQFVQQGKGI